MVPLILWLNIMGFTFLCTSLGAAWLVYSRAKPKWLVSYMWYTAVFAVFAVSGTYGFFSSTYIPPAIPIVDTIVTGVTFLTALLLLIVVPEFVLRVSGVEASGFRKYGIPGGVGIFLVMLVLSVVIPLPGLDRIGTIYLNGYLGAVTLYGVLRIRRSEPRQSPGVALPFLYISGSLYLVVFLEAIVLPIFASTEYVGRVNLVTTGAISMLWGSVTLVYLLMTNRGTVHADTPTVTERFVARFGITPREKEIIELLLRGKSNREIGDELYVSPRTVETHVYNIYRKCSVRNKLGLARTVAENS